MMEEGKYIYCVIDSDEEKEFGSPGIGGRGDTVHSIAFHDIAAVVSDSPIKEYPVSRENMLAHQKVSELMTESYTVLPVKFGTIAKGNAERDASERIRLEVLEKRYGELRGLLNKMEGKIELGLKCLWTNMESIFAELVEQHSDIRILKQKIARGHPVKTRDKRVTLGEKVKKGLDRKREKEEAQILKVLKPLSVDLESGTIFGDKMVTNTSFLVPEEKVDEFDAAVNQISSERDGRMKFKYVGPAPPCNFVELTIVLD
ncbi:GvpL/GvpF family gas vesicle protein [Acidobacteria bacterium AH-259-O06]|nr:GvpL/GvpF family gas vesicle protein [Acidobacteria bacterium AH-259-O06]